jgi:multidrug efflux system outer membrane protein
MNGLRACRWMRPVCVAPLLLAGSATGVVSADGNVGSRLTLAQAVGVALDYNYDMRIAALESDRADNALGETRASYLPRLSVSTNAGYSNRFDEKLRAIDRRGVERTYGLASLGSRDGWVNVYVDQVVFDLSQLRLIERETLAADAMRLSEVQRREDVAYEVTRGYADLVRLEELAALAGETLAAAERLDAQARVLLSAGRTVSSEREQAALYLEEARLRSSELQDDVLSARLALKQMMGEGGDPTILPDLVPESLPGARATDLADPDDAALAATPDLQVLALRRRIEEATVASARAGRLPRLRVRGGYSHYGIKRFDNFPDETYVWLGMDLPIFDGFRVESEVEGARKGVEIAELRYRAALETKRAQVRELRRRLGDAERRLALAARQARNVREELRLADLRLRAERSNLAETLAAYERSRQRLESAIDARFGLIELWASVHRALGRLADTVVGDDGAAPGPAARGAAGALLGQAAR